MERSKLRVGLLLDDFILSDWSVKMIDNIVNSNFAELTLVVLNGNEVTPESSKGLLSKVYNNHSQLGSIVLRKFLELVYTKIIERNTYLPNVDTKTSCKNLLKDCTVISAKTRRTKWSDYFYEEDINTIRDLNIDILVRCGFRILRGDILGVAKYGVWSFHHGDNLYNRGGPAGFWESMESWPETGSVLQILTEDMDNGKILYRSYSCTNTMSVRDNRNNYFWKSLSFLERKIRELYLVGEKEFFDKVAHENRHPVFYSERLYTKPTNRELAQLTFNKVAEKIKLLFTNKLFIDQWILMFHLKDEFSSSLWRYKKIIPPKDRFWADPHVIYKNGKYFIFIEEYIYAKKKGHICLITMDDKGVYSEPKIVLERPYHLSYPFVFEHEGNLYMIPDSLSNNTIELYKCTEFPDKWEFQMNMMEDIRAVDTTILHHDKKYWMFTNVVENDGASTWDELFLFYTDDFFSDDWKPHPQNPIVSDCKSARSAGKLFYEDGRLYRPSQNCSVRYGYGFNIGEIKVLDENNYAEVIVSRVKPNWDKRILGTHTFNRVNSLHVIDAIYRRRR